MAVTIQTFDPATAASDAIGAYATQKRQNALDAAAAKHTQQKDAQTQANSDRDYQLRQQDLQERTNADIADQAYKQHQQLIEARKEADEALHQAREDALAELKERDTRDRNDKQLANDHTKIELAYRAEMKKLANATLIEEVRARGQLGAANIRAAATVEAASIHAGATVEAAGLHEQGADRRAAAHDNTERSIFGARDATTRRGQDLTATAKANATNAANQRNVQNAVQRLSQNKAAPQPPSPEEDPMFAKAMKRFIHDTPAQRATLLSNPSVPPKTKAYLQALVGILSSAPEDVPPPDDAENGMTTDDGATP